ncbi:MAG: T9SS type A sorting domain-containing protein [Bacteroidetes bacterium]|nr:T9SS type A sorting domain-containing protein [Bacteroidota bacterium]
MNKKFFLCGLLVLCFLLVVQTVSYSQSVWTTHYLNNIGGNYLRRVQFVNQTIGWACGGNGTLIKTTNGGGTWIPMSTGTTSFLSCLYFIDENTGWIGSQDAVVKKTTNGGISWYSAPIQTNDFSSDFFFLNSQTGYITSHDNKIHKTTNGGSSWNLLIASDFAYGQIHFFNDMVGYVVAPSYFAKSIDGGVTWTRVLYDGVNQAMTFINQQTGWLTGTNSIKKTTNGCDTWATYMVPMETPFAIKFFNENIGWCAGYGSSGGVICRTLNGGVNWTIQTTEIGNKYYDISFVNQNLGWASGNSIISSTQNGGLVSVSQISSEIPEHFSLKQNFPNPFNPVTSIKFDVKKSDFVSLKVYNMQGSEIKSLVNENMNAGTYEISFNAESLPSGVYFYTLQASDFKETKKMMLVK